jgi:HSP20 family molecular chaperone IbpA
MRFRLPDLSQGRTQESEQKRSHGGGDIRSIHLPEQIDPETAKAEYRNGLLRLTASIAKPTTTTIPVQAA